MRIARYRAAALVISLALSFLAGILVSRNLQITNYTHFECVRPADFSDRANSDKSGSETLNDASVAASSSSNADISTGNRHACENPYIQPGYLLNKGPGIEYATSWVPFYPGLLDTDADDSTVLMKNKHPYYPDGLPPNALLETAPHQWMQNLIKQYRLADKNKTASSLNEDEKQLLFSLNADLEWLRDMRILFLSDSVDRYQIQYICERLDQPFRLGQGGIQATSSCHIPHLNVTFVNWHFASTSVSRPDWWWMKNMHTVKFEDRWDEIYKPTIPAVIGANGRSPDLILINAGLWDYTFFLNAPKNYDGPVKMDRSLNWRELKFYMQRLRHIIRLVRQEFGDNVPMICRTTTFKKSLYTNSAIFDLNRAQRFVCRDQDIEIFDYGDLVSGRFKMYKDMVHIARGPLSMLWSNMLFWYLYRVRGGVEYRGKLLEVPGPSYIDPSEGWKKCHTALMDPVNSTHSI
ncbi:hypothetical protein V1512DRAFT_255618 [Lipomyces arxii]|uniref:uncharacterized protein n=1 Tax=Lipomyces arxii TaxID=56418 RepID=UPI0034CF3B95